MDSPGAQRPAHGAIGIVVSLAVIPGGCHHRDHIQVSRVMNPMFLAIIQSVPLLNGRQTREDLCHWDIGRARQVWALPTSSIPAEIKRLTGANLEYTRNPLLRDGHLD